MSTFEIRHARPEDCSVIVDLIRGLADYENLSQHCVVTPESIHESLFGVNPVPRAIVGWEIDEAGHEVPVAFALFYYNFSTFLGVKGLYLEDIFVKKEFRHKGYGRRIMKYLANYARDNGCGRFEWSVLDWNQPAIDFYESIGASVMPDWRICRLTGENLKNFAD